MKLGFTTASNLPTYFKPSSLSTYNFKPIIHRFISSSSPPPQPPPSLSIKPQIPLFLRPPTFSASVSELEKWHRWAKSLALSVGYTFQNSDNGPDSTVLCRELQWLLEDSLRDPSLSDQLGTQNKDQVLSLRLDIDELYALWKQRIEERRPFQYIVGCEHWRDLVLSVQEGVLIPRPETEKIVDLVQGAIAETNGLKEGIWADLGTGSGAVAIGIAKILGKRGKVIATDLSQVAIAVAGYNVQRYGLQDKIEVRKGSWFEPLMDVKGRLSGLVSNPPYIPSDDIPRLQAEVGKHEPGLALDGGVRGMDDLLHLCNGAASILKPGGFLVLETNGEKQCNFLLDYLENEGRFSSINIVSDFAGIPRFVTAFCR